MKRNTSTVQLTKIGLLAAVYTAVSLLLQPFSFGPVQLRVAEALTVLPVITPTAVGGLTLGCFLTNLLGLFMGANPAGGWDVLLGTAATGIAAVLTYWLRNVRIKNLPILSTVPPVLVNALVVGGELSVVYGTPFWFNALWVGVGQFAACTVCGLLLFWLLEKTGAVKQLK